jgi:hypothetical protein
MKTLRPVAIAVFVAAAAAGAYILFLRYVRVDPPSQLVTTSRSCVTETAPASTASVNPSVPVAAWILGSREGALASWTKQQTDGETMKTASGMERWLVVARDQAKAAAASADRMAAVLKVPRPPAFTPSHDRAAFNGFYDFIEADAQPTARALALTYAPSVCELYKLGAYWGYSNLYRVGLRNQPNVFAQEINYYASRLQLPENLTQRMTSGASSELTDEQVLAQGEEISRAVAENLTGPSGANAVSR